jgi:hypothetical protein
MPQLPEDIIDRITAMERRIQQLSTAVNSRPALNTISGSGVEITDGGYLVVRPPDNGPAVFSVGAWSGEEYGLAIRRQTGELAMTLHSGDGEDDSLQPVRIYDPYTNTIVSDDVATGGLARPWLPMLPPQDTTTARWPQSTSTSWTTIALSYNPVWQPKMRLYVATAVSSGASGQVRVLVNSTQWGDTTTAGSVLDHTGLISSDFSASFTASLTVEIQAQVTSTSGTVYAQPLLMHGRQT